MYRDRTTYVPGRRGTGMANRPRIREPVADVLDDIKRENEYSTYDEAITHALREAGYEV